MYACLQLVIKIEDIYISKLANTLVNAYLKKALI